MVLVLAGEFIMGATVDQAMIECQKIRAGCQQTWFDDEEPVQTVYLAEYYIDKYEVTNSFYKICVDEGICESPKQNISITRSKYFGNPSFDNYPVIYVDWNMAKTYCEWRGARLPTEAEWEKAARGTTGLTYPWGNGLNCSRANYWSNSEGACKGDTTEVGSYESGKSPYGVYDMAGNVWELVMDWYDVYPNGNARANTDFGKGYRSLRGGSWKYDDFDDIRPANRNRLYPTDNWENVGFRCVLIP
jgi:formylglycine-generating enzyme required for sulfatase activity